MQKDKNESLQKWLPFDSLLDKGIIKLKDNNFVKIIKVMPINYNLKSELEKEGILYSYKTLLKTCNFDIQILIQSNKEDLSKHISKIKEQIIKENDLNVLRISDQYIAFITKLNNERKSSSKNFYIVIKTNKKENTKEMKEDILISELNENFFKIKECISRCGNVVYEINSKVELENILFTFFNTRKNFLM